MPISRATTELRRAYPYIFDCAAYAKTQNPAKVKTDMFYSRFEMPYTVFLDYCLDYCTEQTAYLKNEIYKLLAGQPAKYIKVSLERTVYAQPVIIAFSHTDLKTGKEERITNIGSDRKVDMVQIQILKEPLDLSHGWLNVPKAFYAKTRRIYNSMRENVRPVIEAKDGYRTLINAVKDRCDASIPTSEAAQLAGTIIAQAKILESLDPDQGGFYKIYLALEYILANKKRGILSQNYDFLKLCEKCAPEYTRIENDKLYLHRNTEALRYGLLLGGFLDMLPEAEKRIIGIAKITAPEGRKKELNVRFFPALTMKKGAFWTNLL